MTGSGHWMQMTGKRQIEQRIENADSEIKLGVGVFYARVSLTLTIYGQASILLWYNYIDNLQKAV